MVAPAIDVQVKSFMNKRQDSGIGMCPTSTSPNSFLHPYSGTSVVLLMAEILHHLGCMKPYK